ncbi:hypothetical protein ACFL15_00660 [Patescibacteria group bacterium]
MNDKERKINQIIIHQIQPGVIKAENVPVDNSVALRNLEILRNSLPSTERNNIKDIIDKSFFKKKS